jgi:hypothetical protein
MMLAETTETSGDTSGAAFFDKIQPVLDGISSKITKLLEDLGKKFDPSALLSFSELLGSIADEILSDFIDALGQIIKALLEVMGEVIDYFDRLGNAK